MSSHTSLADSLANGTLPGKTSKFTALQQHIDDLTKEKFELVRGLQVGSLFMHCPISGELGFEKSEFCSA